MTIFDSGLLFWAILYKYTELKKQDILLMSITSRNIFQVWWDM